uniref:LIM zinc-binding domain-containing protein n=1 Tax=Anopheles culicifacies TaxID=139723 RepID=A0A182MUC1_9DIPT
MTESGIESPAAPEWLLKLESRREQIKAKLSHESGNGAPCNVCDIRISELTDKPVQLAWVPPNVTPELASDYMRTLGQQNIPIVGSEAAEKRKQQLEYQVPAHDLDTNLCHNLTPYEAGQLSDYVEKIKTHCVGQGTVMRVGGESAGMLQYGTVVQQPTAQTAGISNNTSAAGKESKRPDYMESGVLSDKMKYKLNLMGISSSEMVAQAMLYDPATVLSGTDKSIPEPIVKFHQEYQANPKFRAEMDHFKDRLQFPSRQTIHSESVPYGENSLNSIVPSGSNDSGFGSIPVSPREDGPSHAQLLGPMEALGLSGERMPPPQQGVRDAVAMTAHRCTGCTLPIVVGEVAVKVDRASNSDRSIWHPQCFKCDRCGELLADLVYFYHGGAVYCGRDLAAILKIPRCAACDELIFTKEYTAAEGATFHVRHFCCYHCDGPLAGQQYVMDEKSAQPLCLPCYKGHYAQTCATCKRCIGPTEQGVGWDKIHWHKECFLCVVVNTARSLSLVGGSALRLIVHTAVHSARKTSRRMPSGAPLIAILYGTAWRTVPQSYRSHPGHRLCVDESKRMHHALKPTTNNPKLNANGSIRCIETSRTQKEMIRRHQRCSGRSYTCQVVGFDDRVQLARCAVKHKHFPVDGG